MSDVPSDWVRRNMTIIEERIADQDPAGAFKIARSARRSLNDGE